MGTVIKGGTMARAAGSRGGGHARLGAILGDVRISQSCLLPPSSMSATLPPAPRQGSEGPVPVELQQNPKDCLACRVIGTGALGGVGIYALNQSRAHAPGSVVGKRIMAGVGVCTCTV